MLPSYFSKPLYTIGLLLWVVLSFIVGQGMAVLCLQLFPKGINVAVQSSMLAALAYGFALAFALGIPLLMRRKPITRKVLGINRLPSWSDIGLSLLGVLPYYLLSAVLIWFGTEVVKVIDPQVGQAIDFSNLNLKIEYIVAFLTLVIMAPLAEELLFRGYFLGRLQEKTGRWVAVFITAAAFGLMHLPGDIGENGQLILQWGVVADTFALGLVAGTMRQLSGSIWVGVLLHAIKNGIAYYFLFINPLPPGS